jgi:Protein of unknown function (DUF3800)
MRDRAPSYLRGKKLVRLVYLDESGVSTNETVLTVCGAIVHGDTQLAAIENHFGILLQKHIPWEDRPGFVFHATHIWSGGGYFKNREKWPLERRLEILDDLIAIPRKFDFPVSYGTVSWPDFPMEILVPDKRTEHERQVAGHTIAFGHCCMGIERFVRETFPDEFVILIAEDRAEVRASLKNIIAVFRNPAAVQQLGLSDPDYFPFNHIRDTVHFAKKSESRHLQIADVCAFVMRGHFMKTKHNERFFNVLRPQLTWHPKDPKAYPSAAQSS